MIQIISLYLFAFVLGLFIGHKIGKIRHTEWVNLNDFAKDITLKEGKKVSQNIAQIKETIHLVLEKFANMTEDEQNFLIDAFKKIGK